MYENTPLNRTSTATLEHTVVRRAVVWVGEREYMSGIQMWNGTVPSFVPNPMKRQTATATDAVGPMMLPRSFHSCM